MARTLYNLLIYIIEMLITFAFFNRNYEKRLKSTVGIIVVGAGLFWSGSAVFTFLSNEIINLLLFFLINLIFAITCFKISLKQAIIYSILLDAIMFATEMLTIFMSSYLFKIPVDSFRNDLMIYIILSSISKLFYLIFSQILLLFIKITPAQQTNTKQFTPLFLFPVLTIASSAVFLLISFKFEIERNYQIAISIICTLYIFSCIFIFVYYQLLANKEEKINELESEKRLYNLNNTYLEILEHQNNELQMIFHDTKNHYSMLNSFNNIDDIKAYISKIYPEIEERNSIKISNNKMLDLIISKYIVVCKNNNIKFDYEVKTANLNYIEDSELSIILNNVLDNAVEAAQNSKERQIEFSLRHINNMDLLNCINSCDTPPKHNNGQLITTKFNSNNHGFGTRIIQKHAKKNNGKYEWFYDETEHRFHLTILFQKSLKSDAV